MGKGGFGNSVWGKCLLPSLSRNCYVCQVLNRSNGPWVSIVHFQSHLKAIPGPYVHCSGQRGSVQGEARRLAFVFPENMQGLGWVASRCEKPAGKRWTYLDQNAGKTRDRLLPIWSLISFAPPELTTTQILPRGSVSSASGSRHLCSVAGGIHPSPMMEERHEDLVWKRPLTLSNSAQRYLQQIQSHLTVPGGCRAVRLGAGASEFSSNGPRPTMGVRPGHLGTFKPNKAGLPSSNGKRAPRIAWMVEWDQYTPGSKCCQDIGLTVCTLRKATIGPQSHELLKRWSTTPVGKAA